MPDATKRPLSEWRETEWLQYLQRQARRLTACPHHARAQRQPCFAPKTLPEDLACIEYVSRGKTAPPSRQEAMTMKAMLGLVNDLATTLNTRGVNDSAP